MSSVVTPRGDRDGIPTVILEAMLHRVAVAGTVVSGIPEVVIPGRTGWLVRPGDAADLARALAEAMEDPDRTMRYAQAARGVRAGELRFAHQLRGAPEGPVRGIAPGRPGPEGLRLSGQCSQDTPTRKPPFLIGSHSTRYPCIPHQGKALMPTARGTDLLFAFSQYLKQQVCPPHSPKRLFSRRGEFEDWRDSRNREFVHLELKFFWRGVWGGTFFSKKVPPHLPNFRSVR